MVTCLALAIHIVGLGNFYEPGNRTLVIVPCVAQLICNALGISTPPGISTTFFAKIFSKTYCGINKFVVRI